MTIENKVKNMKLLMNSQTVGFNANATMDDLESAIMQDSVSNDATTNNAEEVEVSSPSPPPAIEQSRLRNCRSIAQLQIDPFCPLSGHQKRMSL